MKNILLILMYILVFQKFGMTSMRTGVFLWPSTLCDQGVENIVNKLRNNKITDVFILVKGEAGSSWLPSSYTYSDYYYKKYKEEKSEVKKKQLFRYYNLLKGTSLIDAFINASHKNNIKVHAWFIVSGDRYFIEKNPGSEVVHIQNGKAHKYPYPLIDNIHVNLSYPGYLKYFLKHVRKAMELPFDGIMLDKIRYTHLAYTWDNIHTSIAVRKGIEIDTVFDIAYKSIYGNDDEKDSFIYDYRDGNKNVTEWIKIKKDEVEKFVKETKKIAKEKKVKFSAAFMPEGAYDPNFADVNYAQNYSELSKYFDFIVIMAYAKSFNKPAAWIKMVVKNAKIRSSCDIWAGIQTYDSVASDLVYEQALNSRIAQADGIVLFRFGEVDKTYWNAYQKAIHEDINKKVNEQINGIIFSGSGTIRNCWLKSADAALLSDKIIPLLLNEKYFCSREIIAKANFVLLPGGGGSAEAKALGKVGLKNIEKYVASGGAIISINETSLYNEYGAKRQDFALKNVFGVGANEAEDESIYVNNYGNGKSIFIVTPIGRYYYWAAQPWANYSDKNEAEYWRGKMVEMLEEANISIPFEITGDAVAIPYEKGNEKMIRILNMKGIRYGNAAPQEQEVEVTIHGDASDVTLLDFMGGERNVDVRKEGSNTVISFTLYNQSCLIYSSNESNLYATIVAPEKGKIYFMDREIMAVGGNKTIAIGGITIEANTNGNRIEFYVDDELKYEDSEEPYQWFWNEFSMGNHEIKVVAYDGGNKASDKLKILKLL